MAGKIIDQEEDISNMLNADYFLIVVVSIALVTFYMVITWVLKSADNTEALKKLNKVK
jgi:hypothetical protein